MGDLSVSLIAASDSKLFTAPTHYQSKGFIDKLDADDANNRIYGARSGRRAVRAHGAIATILVSQPTDEVIAVGTSRSEDGLFTIYITASGENASLSTLNKARRHLEDVWERLSALVDDQPQRGIETPPDLDLHSSFTAAQLVLCIYQHSKDRVIARFKKGVYLGVGALIAEAFSAATAYVMDDPPQSQDQAYILRSELGTLMLLATVIGAADAYQENQSDRNLQTLISAIETACRELDNLGPRVWDEGSSSLFSRCDRLSEHTFSNSWWYF